MKIFIIHGSFGSPKENWFPHLKKELQQKGHKVIIPKFPTPKNQNLKSWQAVFKKFEKQIDERTIFVGHSLGPAFILSVLEKINKRICACFFVSGFLGKLNNEDFDKINKTFTTKKFNWKKIKCNCPIRCVFYSNNDPYIKESKLKSFANKISTKTIFLIGAGHFNKSAGYLKFPRLFSEINKICDKYLEIEMVNRKIAQIEEQVKLGKRKMLCPEEALGKYAKQITQPYRNKN